MQSEQQYLSQYDPSQFEHPSVTVDILIFTVKDRKLHLLLIRRNEHPFMGKWAIPGGFLRMDESADEAAARRIREETGVENIHLEQLYTFSGQGPPHQSPLHRISGHRPLRPAPLSGR